MPFAARSFVREAIATTARRRAWIMESTQAEQRGASGTGFIATTSRRWIRSGAGAPVVAGVSVRFDVISR
jgi:hypothetical protein